MSDSCYFDDLKNRTKQDSDCLTCIIHFDTLIEITILGILYSIHFCYFVCVTSLCFGPHGSGVADLLKGLK